MRGYLPLSLHVGLDVFILIAVRHAVVGHTATNQESTSCQQTQNTRATGQWKEVLVSDVLHGRGELHWCAASLSVFGRQLERHNDIEQDVAVRRLGLHQVVVDRVASNGVIGEVTGVDSVDGQGTVGIGDPAVLTTDGNLVTVVSNLIHGVQTRGRGSSAPSSGVLPLSGSTLLMIA